VGRGESWRGGYLILHITEERGMRDERRRRKDDRRRTKDEKDK
jgi:hypothetical protein